jgi:hypothetical protein
LRYDPADPLSNLEAADMLDRGAARGHAPRKLVVPPHACVVAQEPRRVWSKPGIAGLTALDGGFVVAGYTQTAAAPGDAGAPAAEQVFVVHVTENGKLEPVASLPLAVPHATPRVAAPGIAAGGQGVMVAYVDGAGDLFAQTLRVGAAHGGGSARLLAKGLDSRFAPAVDYSKRGALVAYTLATTPMRAFLVRFDPRGEVYASHDVTPAAMGAAAPAFVRGSGGALLLTADPRNGMSPIARTRLDDEGKPSPGEVVAPVSMMSQPPQLSAAQASFGSYVLFSGYGSGSTTAVGLLRTAPSPGAPEAFVKGTAYGALHHAAVALADAIVIAADSPLAPGKNPKHDLQVAVIDAAGQGPALHVAAPGGDASHVALAAGQRDQVGFAFSAPDGVYWGALRCSH